MSPKLPVVSASKLVKVLLKIGYYMCRQSITDWIQAGSAILMVIISVFGLYFIKKEFNELKQQNELSKTVYYDSFRPIAVFPSLDKGQLKIDTIPESGSLELTYTTYVKNKGKGILFNVGYVYKVFTDDVSHYEFRKEFLSNEYQVEYDLKTEQERGMIVVPEDSFKVVFKTDPLYYTGQRCFFVRSLLLYKDIGGNLLDSDILIRFDFGKERKIDKKPIIDHKGSYSICKPHEYKEDEVQSLLSVVKGNNESLHRALNEEY